MLRPALLSLVCATALLAQQPADPFAPLRFLEGTWSGDSNGEPGKGFGTFTFNFQLDGKILVRTSVTTFPAQGGRPALRHEDLLTVYAQGGQLKALYLDNEGHAIHYAVTAGAEGGTVVFQSEPGPGPAFRLTYQVKGPGRVRVAFAVAAPGKPESFTTHVEGECVRRR